jgi:hypothetical protein
MLLFSDALGHWSCHYHAVVHLLVLVKRSWGLTQSFKRAGLLDQRQLILHGLLLDWLLRVVVAWHVWKVERIVALGLLDLIYGVTLTGGWLIVPKAVRSNSIIFVLHLYGALVAPTVVKRWRKKRVRNVSRRWEKSHTSCENALRLYGLVIFLRLRWLRVAKDIFYAPKSVHEILLARLLSCLLKFLLFLEQLLFSFYLEHRFIFFWLEVLLSLKISCVHGLLL